MTTCTATLGGLPDGLICTRTDHRPDRPDAGHVFRASWLADGHTQEVSDD